MRTFKAKYQDKALNIRTLSYPAANWDDAIHKAFSVGYKKAEEKLLSVELDIDNEERTKDYKPFTSVNFCRELEGAC